MLLVQGQFVTVVALGVEGGDEGSGVFAFGEAFIRDDALAELDVMSNAMNDILVKLLVQEIHGSFSVFTPGDKLADHGIVVH